MREWRFHSFEGLKTMTLDEVPIPTPGPGEVLVKLLCAALNPADHFLMQGKYPRPGKPPYSVGRDGCGTVASLGEGATLSEGAQVIVLRSDVGVSRPGTLAEYVVVPEASLAPLPTGWSIHEGAAGPLVHLTAWQALVDRGGLVAGETVLINGASGGVGSAAIVQAKALGARVIALSGSRDKWPALEALGADVVVDSRAEDMEGQVKQALGGGRVDLVIENLGGPYLQKSVNLVGTHGRICVIGLLAGFTSEVVLGHLIFKCITIHGLNVGDYSAAESQAAWHKIVDVLNRAGQRPLIDRAFPFEETHAAFARLGEGPLGKVVIDIAT